MISIHRKWVTEQILFLYFIGDNTGIVPAFKIILNDDESCGMFEGFFKNMTGLHDLDMKDVIGADRLSQEESANKYKSQAEEAFENNNHDKKLGKKQTPDRDMEFMYHFSKTYKDLTKKIHPDLEKKEHLKKLRKG